MDIEKIIQEVTTQVGGPFPAAAGNIPVYSPPIAKESLTNDVDLIRALEHSVLNPDFSREKLDEACKLARKYEVAALCVSPYYVPVAAEALRGSNVAVDAAVGFPHGAMSTEGKLAEVKECIRNGAKELDVAINILAVKSGCFEDARREFEEIVAIALGKAKVKAVFEHCLYSDDEKFKVLSMVRACGVDMVKIQNMLSGKGADVEDVRFVRAIVGERVGIKIDGGIKTLAQAKELIAAGATRLGLTATEAIAKEALGQA